MKRKNELTMLGAIVMTSAIATGCGATAVSPQLRDARAAMAEARGSAAMRHEPDELHVAERTLNRAEQADDGSAEEAHYAYIADRQARVAMADGNRAEIGIAMERDQQSYRTELESVARARGEALEQTAESLADRQRTVEQQQAQLAEQANALTAEQQARADAEARAQTALERLRELASVRTEANETVITLSGEVLFPTDRAELRPEARDRLLAVADALRSSTQRVTIEGHTDSRGSDTYNQQLSQRRAEAVRTFLLGEGVPGDRVIAQGRGEAEPIASNDSAEGRANNRRVEIILSAPQMQIAAR